METHTLEQLYRNLTGRAPESVEVLAGAGSNRRYFRLKGCETLIGVAGTSAAENRAFIGMARHFYGKGLPVPRIHAVSDDLSCYLQDDLGDVSLFQAIAQGRQTGQFGDGEKQLLRRTVRLLPHVQFRGAEGLDFGLCYPQPEFDRRSVAWDLNYFKYCFLKATGTDFREDLLEDDFERMADVLLSEPYTSFMYRDFQSRNVMVCGGNPYLIDFQGGRKGPFYYDVASFLWQAKANFPDNLRRELADEYLDELAAYHPVPKDAFRERLKHFVLFRTLQVLGAYGFRGYFERKPHFVQSVPYALGNLRRLLEEGYAEYPYLCDVLRRMAGQEQPAAEPGSKQLTVRVMSFSYKKGIPDDPSGNGGGYVFDCRAVHNPGKYEAYQSLTGRDGPVVRFLEEDGGMQRFLEHADALVDAHVQRYLERGFTHLSVCFGCTGGQHRSVYAAQHVAEHVSRKFGVGVTLVHREQHIEQTFASRT